MLMVPRKEIETGVRKIRDKQKREMEMEMQQDRTDTEGGRKCMHWTNALSVRQGGRSSVRGIKKKWGKIHMRVWYSIQKALHRLIWVDFSQNRSDLNAFLHFPPLLPSWWDMRQQRRESKKVEGKPQSRLFIDLPSSRKFSSPSFKVSPHHRKERERKVSIISGLVLSKTNQNIVFEGVQDDCVQSSLFFLRQIEKQHCWGV